MRFFLLFVNYCLLPIWTEQIWIQRILHVFNNNNNDIKLVQFKLYTRHLTKDKSTVHTSKVLKSLEMFYWRKWNTIMNFFLIIKHEDSRSKFYQVTLKVHSSVSIGISLPQIFRQKMKCVPVLRFKFFY